MGIKLKEQLDSFLWAILCFVCAFIFSVKLPPYLGVIVFVTFFTLGAALLKRIWDRIKNKD
jgi:hypothetical protein